MFSLLSYLQYNISYAFTWKLWRACNMLYFFLFYTTSINTIHYCCVTVVKVIQMQLHQWLCFSCLAGIKKCHWRPILCASLCVLLILAAVGVLLWYFCKFICRSLQLHQMIFVITWIRCNDHLTRFLCALVSMLCTVYVCVCSILRVFTGEVVHNWWEMSEPLPVVWWRFGLYSWGGWISVL